MVDLKYDDLKDLTKGFPGGSYHREDMEYRTETQRLLEERYTHYLGKVNYGSYLLEYVPPKLRDREMCLEAVKDYSCALEYVPEELRDEIRVELGL